MDEPKTTEPIISFTVKQLLARLETKLDDGLAAINAKLDDRVTIGVFRALQSELDATLRRVIGTENDIAELQEAGRTAKVALDSAATALATETKRAAAALAMETARERRALDVPVRTWGIWANKAQVAYALAAVTFGIVTVYLALHG